MYVPTIAVIVVLRYYLRAGREPVRTRSSGIAALAGHRPALHRRAILRDDGGARGRVRSIICRGRMADPSRTNLLSFSFIWYQPLSKEICDTWQRLPSNLLGVPVFALLIWLHTPLWRYFAQSDQRRSPIDTHRRIVIAAIVRRQRRPISSCSRSCSIIRAGFRTGRCACS